MLENCSCVHRSPRFHLLLYQPLFQLQGGISGDTRGGDNRDDRDILAQQSLKVCLQRAPSRSVGVRYPRKRRGPYAEGVSVGPKERERRLAKQRVDRSHRGVVVRQCRPPPWTMGEKDVLVLSLAFIFAGIGLAILLFLP